MHKNNSKKAISRTFAQVLLSTMFASSANLAAKEVVGSDISIAKAEPFEITQMYSPAASTIRSSKNTDPFSLTFSAFGQTFTLLLHENDQLAMRFKDLMAAGNITLYAGEIQDVDGSWARLTNNDGKFSGAIFDGKELYLIDSTPATLDAVNRSLKEQVYHDETVVYKASDLKSSKGCGLNVQNKNKLNKNFSYKALVDELKNATANYQTTDWQIAAASATRKIDLKIVADTEYVSTVRGDPRAEVLSQMNIVDGIFSGQVGIKISVKAIDVLATNGTLSSNNPDTLLTRFRSYAGGNNPGISHLFSGKRMGNTLGIAYVDSVCGSYGVGVTQAGGRGTAGALTVAHEIGHNFGAPHDNESGSACRSESSSFLMNPYYNSSDRFSQCSLNQMGRTIAQANCLAPVDNGGGGNTGGGNTGNPKDTLSAPKSTYTVGEKVVLNYKNGSGSTRDWVGIFKRGELAGSCQQRDNYLDWQYTNGQAGTLGFNGLAKGDFQAQMFSNDGYCHIGTALNFSVVDGGGNGGGNGTLSPSKPVYRLGENVTIQYRNGSGSSKDWVGIFKRGSLTKSCVRNDTYLAWKYTNGNTGTLSFAALASGDYQAQLFAKDGYCYIGEAANFSITQ